MNLKMFRRYLKNNDISFSDMEGNISVILENGDVITVSAEKSMLCYTDTEYWFAEQLDDGTSNFVYVPNRVVRVHFKLKKAKKRYSCKYSQE